MPFWIVLSAQVVVFIIWTYAMFRMLFAVHAIAVNDTGKSFPGPIAFLASFTAWLHDPSFKGQRKMLFVSFLLLIGLTIASVNARANL